jgi:hypothetical protein
MSYRHSAFAVLSVLAATTFFAGCGVVESTQKAAKEQKLSNHLKELGLAFWNFHDERTKAPKSWEELQEKGLSSEARQQIQAAGYRVILGVDPAKATIGTSNFVLAYPANSQSDPILVLMMDGSVPRHSQADFQNFIAQQQPFLSEAVILEPTAASPATAPASTQNNPNVPPPPPASGS